MRMSACFLPIDFRQNITSKLQFRYTEKISIPCQISKNILTEIITILFTNYKFTVFGYNNRLDEFWCKKNVSNKCMLYFTTNIHSINSNLSNLVITPLSGDNSQFNNLLNVINKTLKLYQPNMC